MRHAQTIVFAALAAAATASATAASPVEIELRPDVMLETRQVRLGDVAFLRTQDFAGIEALVRLPLGVAPAPGREVVLDRMTLQRWIVASLGLRGHELAWHGAERAVLRSRPAAEAAPASRPVPASIRQDSTPVAPVARGDWVTLLSHSGRVQIEGRAEALQEGAPGQNVRVRIAGSQAPVEARVIERGRVELAP